MCKSNKKYILCILFYLEMVVQSVLVVDSGVGGLTVLQSLQSRCPFANYLYLGDTAFAPYGTKTADQVANRLQRIVEHFADVDICVLACNTASTQMQQLSKHTTIPIIDVINPTCRHVAENNYGKVALLATNLTVDSGAYQRLLASYGISVTAFRCSNFVRLVETNACQTTCRREIKQTLWQLPYCHADCVILGCTHFPLLGSALTDNVCDLPTVSCQLPTVQQFEKFYKPDTLLGKTQLFCTSANTNIAQTANRLGIVYDSLEVVVIE